MTMTRRTVLRGVGGAVLALPFLEAMSTSMRAQRAHAAAVPSRLVVLYFPNGTYGDANGTALYPTGTGKDYVLAPPWSPLEPHRADLTLLKNIRNEPAIISAFPNHPPAATCFLTCVPINKSYDDLRAGPSMDTLLAAEIGTGTRLRSLALGSGGPISITDEGYSTVYYQNISWRSETRPAPRLDHPQLLFDALFGSGDPALNASRRQQRLSVLDFVQGETARLRKHLGSQDGQKLDEYLTSVRQVEEVVSHPPAENACPDRGPMPSGMLTFEAQLKTTLDLIVLALRCDLTRVVTYMMDTARSGRSFDGLGSHHQISHHGNDPEMVSKLLAINQFYASQLSYFLAAMKAVRDPDGTTLLDRSAVLFGSGLGDSNEHRKDHLPLIVAGRANGSLRPGGALDLPVNTPLANLHLTLLQRLGSTRTTFGDSTGVLPL